LTQVASVFDQSANQARELISRIDSRLAQLDASWDGCAQTRFYGEYQSWKGQMQTFLQILQTGSTELKQAAERFTQADV